jgi:hypothetical protein
MCGVWIRFGMFTSLMYYPRHISPQAWEFSEEVPLHPMTGRLTFDVQFPDPERRITFTPSSELLKELNSRL